MNQRDRETLLALLAQLWDTRNGPPGSAFAGNWLTPEQTELLAAAIRIVADIDGEPNDLPNPWPANWLHKLGTPREPYSDATYRAWLAGQPWWTRARHWLGWG